jgi:predicted  nucleic acid-binding Zn-ribbon protein
MSPDLERLIRLQKLDQDAETRRRTLADLPAALQALDERINIRQQTLDAAKARLTENQASRRALDKDLAVVQGRLTKFKDQLMEVKTNKEYLAMQHEISMAQDGVRTFEDKILEVMMAADELDGEIKAADKALAEEKVKVNEERTTRQKQSTTMESEIAELTGARAKVVAEMSREAVALFDHVSRARKGHAMAEARDGHCTACHVRLRPQLFNEVRKGDKLIQCDSCTRILYSLPKPVTPEAQKTTASAAPARS